MAREIDKRPDREVNVPRTESDAGERVEIRGLIIPVEWDRNGRVTGVVLSTFDEQEYRVETTGAAGGIDHLVGREVMVMGRRRRSARGEGLIRVDQYRLLD
jgi:hypothetical protein